MKPTKRGPTQPMPDVVEVRRVPSSTHLRPPAVGSLNVTLIEGAILHIGTAEVEVTGVIEGKVKLRVRAAKSVPVWRSRAEGES